MRMFCVECRVLMSDVNMRILMRRFLLEMSGEAGVVILEDLFWGAGVVVDADVIDEAFNVRPVRGPSNFECMGSIK